MHALETLAYKTLRTMIYPKLNSNTRARCLSFRSRATAPLIGMCIIGSLVYPVHTHTPHTHTHIHTHTHTHTGRLYYICQLQVLCIYVEDTEKPGTRPYTYRTYGVHMYNRKTKWLLLLNPIWIISRLITKQNGVSVKAALPRSPRLTRHLDMDNVYVWA